jgi:hypothetical protein
MLQKLRGHKKKYSKKLTRSFRAQKVYGTLQKLI